MDAIRKKMQSLKVETDQMVTQANALEKVAKDSNTKADKFDCDIRDLQKKINGLEGKYDDVAEKLEQAVTKEEEKEKDWKAAEEDVNNLARKMLLLEEEVKRRETDLAGTTMDLCLTSKDADRIARQVKILQSKNMTNEVLLEELDKEVKEAKFMAEDSEKKLDEISRRLGVMEDELKRAMERAALADDKNVNLEEQLRMVGENMKQLEVSEEKALEREEKFKQQIRHLVARLKEADSRAEYGEMNITKLNIRIDDIEDEIVREKLKIKHVSDELSETFDDMLTRY
ncbi:tropomyosin-like isoform X4 [Tigriopus californicus]|uniref:tropomyosin-like isoform X4 n=1 Tax=Tigriopus californicus TaxID=6832 RepID=UPI0027D9ECA0|nr:tropomyosin-like isoform X4 [Tigriopus californicus]